MAGKTNDARSKAERSKGERREASPVESENVEPLISELEIRIDRLRSLYDQYFCGIERILPHVPHKDVERRIQFLQKSQIRNTALRFRFQMILQRHNTYQAHWARICRQIEEGTYKRDVRRARERLGGPKAREVVTEVEIDLADFDFLDQPQGSPEPSAASASAGEPEQKAPDTDRGGSRPVFDFSDIEASLAHLEAPAKPVPAPSSAGTLGGRARPQLRPIPGSAKALANQTLAPPGAATPSGGIQAAPPAAARAPIARPMPEARANSAPAAPRSSPAEAPSRPSLPSASRGPTGAPSRAPGKPPPLPPKRTAPPLPSGGADAKPSGSLNSSTPQATPEAARSRPRIVRAAGELAEERVKQLYTDFIEAKRNRQESTAAITYDSVAQSIRDSSAKLRAKHSGRQVDFEVTEKDGKTILRPVIK